MRLILLILQGCTGGVPSARLDLDSTAPPVIASQVRIDPSSIEVAPTRSCSVIVHFDLENAYSNALSVGCDPAFRIEAPAGDVFDGDILEVYAAAGWTVPTLGACWVELPDGSRGEVAVNLVLE